MRRREPIRIATASSRVVRVDRARASLDLCAMQGSAGIIVEGLTPVLGSAVVRKRKAAFQDVAGKVCVVGHAVAQSERPIYDFLRL